MPSNTCEVCPHIIASTEVVKDHLSQISLPDQWGTKDQNPHMNTRSSEMFSRCHRAAQSWGMSNIRELQQPILYQGGWLLLPREKWGKEFSNRDFFQTNPPAQLRSHPGRNGEWMGWAAEMGQLQSVHNNRVWVICAVWPDPSCLLSCCHHEAISRMKLWIGRGEFLSNYENVSGKGIFTKAC